MKPDVTVVRVECPELADYLKYLRDRDRCEELVERGISVKLDRVLAMLGAIHAQNERIIMNEDKMITALGLIDTATTQIGAGVNAMSGVLTNVSTVVGSIGTGVDALVAALQNAGVPQELIDQALAIGSKAAAAVTATDTVVAAANALVPVLQGIATKANNVVPIPVPDPLPIPPPEAQTKSKW